MSDASEIDANDVTLGRNYFIPQTIFMRRDGQIILPTGSILNALNATIEFNGSFLDLTVNQNIVQGITLSNPNSVADLVSRSVILSSSLSNLVLGAQLTILSSSSGTIGATVAGTNDYLIGTTSCSIDGNNRCGILSSNTSTITTTSSSTIISSTGSSITSAPNCGIIASNTNNTIGSGGDGSFIIGSQFNNITDRWSGIIASRACSILKNTINTFPGDSLLIGGSANCTITKYNTQCAILCSNGSTITGSDFVGQTNGRFFNSGIFSCNSSLLRRLVDDNTQCSACLMIGCTGGNITYNGGVIVPLACFQTGCTNSTITDSSAVSIQGGSSCTVTGANRVLMGGLSNTVTSGITNLVYGESITATSRTHAYCFGNGANPTADNQMAIATDILQVGTKNITNTGYTNTTRGITRPSRDTSIDTTLAVTDNTINITTTTARIITVPTAASMGANFVTGITKEWLISGVQTSTPSRLLLSGGDTFKSLTNNNSYRLDFSGSILRLVLVNNSVSPYWTIAGAMSQGATLLTNTANNFGVTPPKSDAAQLPTSTSEANHKTLTTTSYVTFDSNSIQNTLDFLISGAGVTVQVPGYYNIIYSFFVRQTATVGVTFFMIRSDIANVTAGATVANSYTETAGYNLVEGTRYVQFTVPGIQISTAGTQLQLRLSQDSTQTIVSTASIVQCKIFITGTY